DSATDDETLTLECQTIQAVDFDKFTGITGYTNATTDTKNGYSVLQIANRDQVAAAQYTHTGVTADAIFKINAMQEFDGEPTYKLSINNTVIGQATNTRTYGTDAIEYSIEKHQFNQDFVSVATGDLLQIDFNNATNGLVPEDDTTATARGRWHSLEICTEKLSDDSDDNTVEVPETPVTGGDEVITGELRQWHPLTISFNGPDTSENNQVNPFTDYRLQVTFSQGNHSYVIPGYYAADGDAGNTNANSGNQWRVHFTPDLIGDWDYQVSFRTGTNIAINTDANAGESEGEFDGVSGSFKIISSNKSGRDFRSKGRLNYVNERYLRFAETNEYFLKQGADSPENLLAYDEFDGDFKSDGNKDDLIKTWHAHESDWQAGDPVWMGDKGKGLIGAVNYIASEGLNAMSFLTMNINGDDRNVFPYTNYNERLRMDVSRLAQWDVVFTHMQNNGIFLHFKTQETENNNLLDGGELGLERKLYYRELIARFSHHLALNWNLGEENTQTTAQVKAMAQFFKDNDPYHHPVVLHTYPGQKDKVYTPLVGNNSELDGLSLQMGAANFSDVHGQVKDWIVTAENSSKTWVVSVDEPGDAQYALRPDNNAGQSHVDGRKNALWGTLMAGGTGNEWYFGYQYDHSDLSLQDFRSRDLWWDVARFALEFFNDNNIPFWNMNNDNSISSASNDYAFYQHNNTYVVYLKQGGTTELNLSTADGEFQVFWYNPRTGGALQQGTVTSVMGGDHRSLGEAPSTNNSDWVVLVRKGDGSAQPVIPEVPDNGNSANKGSYIEKDGLIIMEAENSSSALGLWTVNNTVSGYTGSGHIEFTGNGSNGGPATSPLKYNFYVTKAGDYQLYLRAHKRLDGQASDKNNDAYVRMEGDFTSGSNNVRLDVLQNDTKLYGGSPTGWGWADKLNPTHDEHLNAIYNLKANTEYTFVISGRSINFNIDRIILRHSSVTVDTAKSTSLAESLLCDEDTCAIAEPTTPTEPVLPVVDECNTTAQCVSIYGETANDCVNSASNESYCECDAGICGNLFL
ncbi:DUF5060 domain-containing protein, partial [Colwellia sp. E2M01]|uniref:DUF5060 domain-containing protein n=1 Tax=Colwellia sp. E2M01 TaxID=2841561 RepID=UPI001C0854A9